MPLSTPMSILSGPGRATKKARRDQRGLTVSSLHAIGLCGEIRSIMNSERSGYRTTREECWQQKSPPAGVADGRGEGGGITCLGCGTARPPQASRKTDPRPPSFQEGTGSLAILRTVGLDARAMARAFCGGLGPPHSVVFSEVHSEVMYLKPQGSSV